MIFRFFFSLFCLLTLQYSFLASDVLAREQHVPSPSIDYRGLEENMRQMIGKIEELNFQILQIEDQLQKMKQDMEFRFEELEKKKNPSDSIIDENLQRPSQEKKLKSSAQQNHDQQPALKESFEQGNTGAEGKNAQGKTKKLGKPPADLGTVVFDGSGNVVGGSVGDRSSISSDPKSLEYEQSEEIVSDSQVSSFIKAKAPDKLYQYSYNLFLLKKYRAAEFSFRSYIKNFSSHTLIADAHFWLGESLFAQQRYAEVVEILFLASKKFPKSVKVPDMLLKLGIALIKIDQKELACETFKAIPDRYPKLSVMLKKRIEREKLYAGC